MKKAQAEAAGGVRVRQATIEDLEPLARLFDAYRRFYGRPGDVDLARAFLAERFRHWQSIVFVGENATGELLGFTQLYPSFSSVAAARIFVLNDLFVRQDSRQGGLGSRLLDAAAAYARAAGAVRLTLSTATGNLGAQRLYERKGWQRERIFHVYNLPL